VLLIFNFILFVDKIAGALPYYVFNIRAVVKLGNEIFFDRDAWIAMIKEVVSKFMFMACC